MRAIIPSRRLLATITIATAAGVASAAAVGFAQNGGSNPAVSTPAAPVSAVLDGVHDGLVKLVAQGTIDQSQADAVQQQADAGSVDPKTLVGSGVVTDPQMHAIADMIDHVKQAGG